MPENGLFDEVTATEVADCKLSVCERIGLEGTVLDVTIEGTVCVGSVSEGTVLDDGGHLVHFQS